MGVGAEWNQAKSYVWLASCGLATPAIAARSNTDVHSLLSDSFSTAPSNRTSLIKNKDKRELQ